MKRAVGAILAALLIMMLCVNAVQADSLSILSAQPVSVAAIDGLSEDFITGADVSSLLSLEAGGRVFYGFDGREQDLLKTLSESGVNYIRVRVWNDPFDSDGNGYGGGNCTVDTAIELGRRAAEYGMGLLVDLHYSDFWADPGKQQAPKAWAGMTYDEKTAAVYGYTADSIRRIQEAGVTIGMIQVGNETNNGFCGEAEPERRYALTRTAAKAVRDADGGIQIAVHFTNPESARYTDFADDLISYNVDYDIFSTSFYPEYHGTVDNLKQQLRAVHDLTGKKVMIAETSWAYTSDIIGAYKRSVQGQADEIADCVRAMTELGDWAVGVFYWEPAWIDVPGETEDERSMIRENCGAGWASSYAGSYDPDDAGRYYGATACIPTSLFDPEGHPLDSLRTFLYLREGSSYSPKNYLADPSFEGGGDWKITEARAGTVGFSDDPSNARDGDRSLHFWDGERVEFTAEQTVTGLPEGGYTFSISAQGECIGEDSVVKIYVLSGGERYERSFTLGGWRVWKAPMLGAIPCAGGEITVGVQVSAGGGSWGSFDLAELTKDPEAVLRGDADGDGRVTVIDATAIQRRLAELPTASFNETAADVTGGGLSVTDATAIQRYLAGFDDPHRVGVHEAVI